MARPSGQKPSDGNGSSANSDDEGRNEAPRLTLGQKFLIALPDLGRKRGTDRPEAEPVAENERKKTVPKPRPAKSGPTARQPKISEAADADETGDVADRLDVEDSRNTDQLQDPDGLDDDLHVADEEVAKSTSRPGTLGGLLRGSGTQKRSGTAVYDEMSTGELTTLMRKLDDKERLLAMLATPLGFVLSVVLILVTVHDNPVGKGHESTGEIFLYAGVSVAFAICVFATAWFRRRSLTAFALLFLGLSLGPVSIGLPFLFLGGYLLLRAWRIQKVLTSRGVNPRGRRPARPAAERGSPRNATSNQPRSQPRNQKGRQNTKSGTSGPAQSKRYTPPKPAPKRPAITKAERAASPEKSTWFERATRSTPSEPS